MLYANLFMEENMKKLTKLAAFAVALVASLSFVACSDISSSSDDATVSSGYSNATSSATTKALTLNVSSTSDLIDFSTAEFTEAAREIVPAALDSTKVKFYLGGTDLVTGTALTVQEVGFVGKDDGAGGKSKVEGTVTVDLEASNYRFTLVAVQNTVTPAAGWVIADYINNAVLIAYANADLRYTKEAAAVNFVLMSDGISGNGTIDLDVYLDNWSAASLALKQNATDLVISKATIALYNIETGSVIAGTTVTPFDLSAATAVGSAIKYIGGDSSASIAAGTYDVTVTFTLQNGNKYIYSDKIIILPNQVTEGELAIPEVIELPPAAPTAFKIGYIAPAYKDSDYYKVVFNWTDNSKNEQYFELDLYDVTADTTNITPATANNVAAWASSSSSNTKTYSFNFYGLKVDDGPSWYAGSLNRNNEAAVFYIPLNKRYLARIRAVNQAGASEYAITEIASGDERYSAPAATEYTVSQGGSTAESAYLSAAETKNGSSDPAVVKFNTDIINLFRIRYELSGGTFDEGAVKTVYYFDQLAAGNPIMIPDGAATVSLETGVINTDSTIYNSGNALTLKYGSEEAARKWTAWKINSISGDTYPSLYTAATAGAYSAGTTYYTVYSTSADADINGNTTTYAIANPQPTQDSEVTANHYKIDGLANYLGYKSIVLYASYSSSTFGVEIKNVADYMLETNLKAVASVTGTGSPQLSNPPSDASIDVLVGDPTGAAVTKSQYLTINRDQSSGATTTTASNLVFTCSYVSNAPVTYTKLQLELFQQGDTASTGVSVGVYNANSTSSGTITIPLGGLKTGSYRAVFKGYTSSSNNKAPYEYPVYIQLND